MDLRDYILALRKRWAVIVALTAIGGVLGFLYAQSLTPMYKASTKVYVSLNGGQTAGELVQGSTFVQNSIESFVQLASMPVVLQPVIDELDLDVSAGSLGRSVSASSPLNTFIIEISVTDPDPSRAAAVADAVGAQLAVKVGDLSSNAPDGEEAISLSTVSPAATPSYPFAPNKRVLLAAGVAAGFALGLAFALAAAALDTRVRTSADVAKLTRYPILGAVHWIRDGRRARTTVLDDPRSVRAEGFRRVQTNLQYLDTVHQLRSIVVTSATAHEGKTSTAINLALAAAEKGASVLLVDADLRRPAVADALHIESAAGLTTVLIGRATLDEVVQTWGRTNLHVLTTGEVPPNPSQLLDSDAMRDLIAAAAASYDLVVFDTPPVLPVVDASVVGRATDGVLMVIGLRQVRRQQVRAALESVEAVGARILGVVATGTRGAESPSSYGYDVGPLKQRRRGRHRPAAGTPVPPSARGVGGEPTSAGRDARTSDDGTAEATEAATPAAGGEHAPEAPAGDATTPAAEPAADQLVVDEHVVDEQVAVEQAPDEQAPDERAPDEQSAPALERPADGARTGKRPAKGASTGAENVVATS
ncbi:polysaccharide biosynthesis tyrosine autokinase [Cellulomonas fengjieae]|uniref:Polysaccharide biosynthesis tyrosine autokinase n=1 Tax=Cellulomonas fengjieae TaxID=2819978 RepID=A0ABS3SMI6_9CELL|nr:polysaccharide biosynthesis tyrosine autokinase [Cellulomonas fengjieae]MBO3086539.1 polysaccharide biosynthesis tyrosine autokinase [Cellulomonas fengjieae]QVI66604.1 polysaccharide biosynthesis tyrosine autokinase [Cellulomonas fengjieae]